MSVYTVHIGSSNVTSLPKSLAVTIVIMVALLLSACGGDDLETLTGKDKAMAGAPALQTIEARTSNGTAVDPHSPNVQAVAPTLFIWFPNNARTCTSMCFCVVSIVSK